MILANTPNGPEGAPPEKAGRLGERRKFFERVESGPSCGSYRYCLDDANFRTGPNEVAFRELGWTVASVFEKPLKQISANQICPSGKSLL